MICKIKNVGKLFSNPMGKIHGGAMASWVDIITSLAIGGFDDK